MRARMRQAGAFLLMSMVFMIIAAFGMLAAMATLSGATGGAQGSAHMGYQAFFAAESGLNYGIYQMEQHYADSLPTAAQTIAGYPAAAGCQVTISISAPTYPPAVANITWTITSAASCADAALPSARTLAIQVTASPRCWRNKKNANGTCKYSMQAPNYAVTIGSWSFD